jgi:hypothetical protein
MCEYSRAPDAGVIDAAKMLSVSGTTVRPNGGECEREIWELTQVVLRFRTTQTAICSRPGAAWVAHRSHQLMPRPHPLRRKRRWTPQTALRKQLQSWCFRPESARCRQRFNCRIAYGYAPRNLLPAQIGLQ